LQSAFDRVCQTDRANIQVVNPLLKFILLFFGEHSQSGANKLVEFGDFQVKCFPGLYLFAKLIELLVKHPFEVYFHGQTGV